MVCLLGGGGDTVWGIVNGISGFARVREICVFFLGAGAGRLQNDDKHNYINIYCGKKKSKVDERGI